MICIYRQLKLSTAALAGGDNERIIKINFFLLDFGVNYFRL